MGTATKLQNRHEQKIDDRKENDKKKKENVLETASLGMNAEHAQLLGFKTGFRVFVDKKDKPAEKKEGEKEKESPEIKKEVVAEGEEKKEAPADKDNKDAGDKGGDKKEKYGGKKDYKGGRGGDSKGYKSGYRKEEKQSKPNFEDSSAFPKLGWTLSDNLQYIENE